MSVQGRGITVCPVLASKGSFGWAERRVKGGRVVHAKRTLRVLYYTLLDDILY